MTRKEAQRESRMHNAHLRARLNLLKGEDKDKQPLLSFEEIARELGISKNQAKASFEMGMRKLRMLLAKRGIALNYAEDGEWKF